MQLFKEFREFAVKGNVIDLAVGVIIGAAFGKIVTSLVDDLIMPPIAAISGNVNFADMKWTLRPELHKQNPTPGGPEIIEKAVTLNYGNFINVTIQFLIVAWAIFLLVKALNKAKARFEPPPAEGDPVVKQCQYCLSDIPANAIKCRFCTSNLAEPA
ncbi:MAG: large-conductance mechanosensitive channel protein MscL [Fimbriimonas sp.]